MIDEHLAKTPLFQTISASELQQLSDVCELRRFRKGQHLFDEGQPAASTWVIQRGWVYLVKRTPQGVPVTIFTVTPEEVLCGYSAVVGHSVYYASAVAATETTAIRIPGEEFTRLVRRHAGFAEQVLVIYHARMRRMAEAIALAHAPVEQRLAHTLLRLKATFGNPISVTHQELAHMAGTRWETSIRTIAVFKRKRWLSSSRGKMVVLQPRALQALLAPNGEV